MEALPSRVVVAWRTMSWRGYPRHSRQRSVVHELSIVNGRTTVVECIRFQFVEAVVSQVQPHPRCQSSTDPNPNGEAEAVLFGKAIVRPHAHAARDAEHSKLP